MQLTTAQAATLKAAILAEANATLVAALAVRDDTGVADWYNATTATVVWRSHVQLAEVGKAFVATSLSSMTSLNNDRLVSFALYNGDGINPSRADHRAFFDDVFSPTSGAPARTALATLWRRTATRAEALFATGIGTTASPATLAAEGPLSAGDVAAALN